MRVNSLEDLIDSYENKFRERRKRMEAKEKMPHAAGAEDPVAFDELLSDFIEKLKESDFA